MSDPAGDAFLDGIEFQMDQTQADLDMINGAMRKNAAIKIEPPSRPASDTDVIMIDDSDEEQIPSKDNADPRESADAPPESAATDDDVIMIESPDKDDSTSDHLPWQDENGDDIADYDNDEPEQDTPEAAADPSSDVDPPRDPQNPEPDNMVRRVFREFPYSHPHLNRPT